MISGVRSRNMAMLFQMHPDALQGGGVSNGPCREKAAGILSKY